MNFTDYHDYFQNLAAQHVQIGNGSADGVFVNLNLFDMPTEKPSALRFPKDRFALVLVDPEFTAAGPHADQQLLNAEGEFWLVSVTGKEDPDRIKSVKAQALEICRDILSKMISDSLAAQPAFMQGLVDKSWVLSKIGPLWDACYGYRVVFEIKDFAGLSFNEEKWTTEP